MRKYKAYLLLVLIEFVPDRRRPSGVCELSYRKGNGFYWHKPSKSSILQHHPPYDKRRVIIARNDNLSTDNWNYIRRWIYVVIYRFKNDDTRTMTLTKIMTEFEFFSTTMRTEYSFVQTETGRPLTQDNVNSIFARSFYHVTGKKTNSHLLRNMIDTSKNRRCAYQRHHQQYYD